MDCDTFKNSGATLRTIKEAMDVIYIMSKRSTFSYYLGLA